MQTAVRRARRRRLCRPPSHRRRCRGGGVDPREPPRRADRPRHDPLPDHSRGRGRAPVCSPRSPASSATAASRSRRSCRPSRERTSRRHALIIGTHRATEQALSATVDALADSEVVARVVSVLRWKASDDGGRPPRPRRGGAVEGRTVEVRVPRDQREPRPRFRQRWALLSASTTHLLVTALPAGRLEIEVTGSGASEIPRDESNLIVRTIAYVFADAGRPVPGLRIVAENAVPHGRGLGSSGAAVAAGVLAAKGLLEGDVEIGDNRPPRLATELEGHPTTSRRLSSAVSRSRGCRSADRSTRSCSSTVASRPSFSFPRTRCRHRRRGRCSRRRSPPRMPCSTSRAPRC